MAKRMSDNYGRLIFKYKSLGSSEDGSDIQEKCHSMLQFRTKISLNKMTDQYFYEDLIKIYQKSLRKAFPDQEDDTRSNLQRTDRVEEEIARLFRGTTFNKSVRDHERQQKEIKYPELKIGAGEKKSKT